MLIQALFIMRDESFVALHHVEKSRVCVTFFPSSPGKYKMKGHSCTLFKLITSIYHNSHNT